MKKQVYKRGNYAKLESFWRSEKKGIATRQERVADGVANGMTESEAGSSVTVLLSPRSADGRGDCRGNLSAQGHLYFAEPLAKAKGENRRFRFRMRATPLEKRSRNSDKPVVKAKTRKIAATAVVEPTVQVVAPATETVPTV